MSTDTGLYRLDILTDDCDGPPVVRWIAAAEDEEAEDLARELLAELTVDPESQYGELYGPDGYYGQVTP